MARAKGMFSTSEDPSGTPTTLLPCGGGGENISVGLRLSHVFFGGVAGRGTNGQVKEQVREE